MKSLIRRANLLLLAVCLMLIFTFGWIAYRILIIYGLTNVIDRLHLNMWDWAAILIALISLSVSVYNTYAQYQTMRNTSTLTPKMIWTVMLSLYNNIVRNTIMLYALRTRLEDEDYRGYPSEDILEKMTLHFLRLEQIPVKCMEGKSYYHIKGMIELTDFFNIHLAVTQKHLMSSSIPREIKSHDVGNLISLHWMYACNLYRTMLNIYPIYADSKKLSDDMCSSRTADRIRTYLLSLTKDYSEALDVDNELVNSGLESDSKRFVNSVFGKDTEDANKFLERLGITISSRLGVRPDGLPFIIIIPND